MKKRIFLAAGAAMLVGLVTLGLIYLNTLIPIITGYSAKYLCSSVFISNRNPADVEHVDLNFSFIKHVTNEINYREKSVTSHFLWGQSKAIFRDGFGCTLLRNVDEFTLRKRKFPLIPGEICNQDPVLWPAGSVLQNSKTGIDENQLAKITENLMFLSKYHGNVFAFLVVHDGHLVAEGYQRGFNAKTRLPGWSIAKSFTNAIAGIMVRDNLLNIHGRTGITSWKFDDRNRITIDDLMQMQSGLRWNEDYGNRSDVTLMLYNNKDFAGFALAKPLDFPAGSHWYYSSGSANIVSYLLRRQFKDDDTYYTYAHTRLFNKIGMPGAILETDPSGTQVGSSYIYATARDYARFGLLYLQDGIFNGERILPEGWVTYTTTPATNSKGNYGSFFWLNRGKQYPSAPGDMYYCNGHNGQRIFIIPSKALVVVVLGHSPKPDNDLNFNLLLEDILATVKE